MTEKPLFLALSKKKENFNPSVKSSNAEPSNAEPGTQRHGTT